MCRTLLNREACPSWHAKICLQQVLDELGLATWCLQHDKYLLLAHVSPAAECHITTVVDACAMMSDHGYPLIQTYFQALQVYSWGFAVIKFVRNCS